MPNAFDLPAPPTIAIDGGDERFPVGRIFCVGRNYADHAREMGSDPDREPPFFFYKFAQALVPGGGTIPIRPRPLTIITRPSWSSRSGARARRWRRNWRSIWCTAMPPGWT